MGQVLTNNTGLAYAIEASPNVLPGSPDWKTLEPEAVGAFGAEVQSVSRNPISKKRQRRKGTTVGIDAAAEFDADTTIDSLVDFTEAFVFATAVNADLTFRAAAAVATGFTIPAATVAQGAKMQWITAGMKTLLHVAGYATAARNTGTTLIELTADLASTDVTIVVGSGLATETAPSNAEVTVAGIRAEDGDLALAVSGNIGTLTSGNNAAVNNLDFTTLGLTAGQRVCVGGMAAANRFGSTSGGSNDSFGGARIRTIAAGTLTLDKMDATLTASDGTDTGSGGTDVFVDLLFGRFARNVSVDNASYEARTFHFEGGLPNLFETEPPTPVANPDGFEYVTGASANIWTWNMPIRDKSTSTFGFIARDAEDPVDNASRKSGASTARDPLFTSAMNTSADFFRLRVTETDDTGLMSDFKDLTVVMTNNLSPEYVLGNTGARFINNGNFEMNVTGDALFLTKGIADRIRAGTTITMDWLVKNDDGAVAVDVPEAVIKGNGGKTYEVGATVRIGLDIEAFEDSLFGTSVGVSFFPVYPTV